MNNLDKKLVINRLSGLVTKYFVARAQQKNAQKLAEATSSIKDSQDKKI